MSVSDPSDVDSSSDESQRDIELGHVSKRRRTNTYEASSTTSHGSGVPDSEEEATNEESKLRATHRLSSSSISEHCSSPSDTYDDYKPGSSDSNSFKDSVKPSFFSNNASQKNLMGFKADRGEYSDVAKNIMSKMGFKDGKGLGKYEHGRTVPVESSTQKGRRGLGLKPSEVGDIPQDFKWTPDDDLPNANEDPLWLPQAPEEILTFYKLNEWMQEGKKITDIKNETTFIKPHILQGILSAKNVFDSLESEDMRNARFRSNPFETIGAVIFLNRAAVKMANMDAVFNQMFTIPKSQDDKRLVDSAKEILYFADVCAGPGGFSEYIFYRRKWKAKGFGFTLKGQNDFKLSNFYAGTPETFHTYYGTHKDGNIFDPENLVSLKDYVLQRTDDKGVHFLMADGGFSVEGQENIQEVLSKQLYLCQCLAAIMLVRPGGNCVIKLFDVFTLFSVSLIYIMYRCFDQVCIHKPVTSRPANSERYLICKWKRLGTEAAEDYLFAANSKLWNEKDFDTDISTLVPLEVLQEDKKFFKYIYKSNCIIGEKQIRNLLKIAEYSKTKDLKETKQLEMKKKCLELWNLPDQVRIQPERLNGDEMLSSILNSVKLKRSNDSSNLKGTVFGKPPKLLANKDDLNYIDNIYDWHFVFLNNKREKPDLKLYIGCGGKQVYSLEGEKWHLVVEQNSSLVMPARTLIYAEIVRELRGSGTGTFTTKALHIVDAIMLGGIDVSFLSYHQRINECNLFCTALAKPEEVDVMPIRCKSIFPMEKFSLSMNELKFRSIKTSKKALTTTVPHRIESQDLFYEVGSILFLKEVKEPWKAHISRKTGNKYFFLPKVARSEHELIKEACMDTISTYMSRALWPLENLHFIYDDAADTNGLTKKIVEEYIYNKSN